jgi:hypothetical protein
MDPLLSQSLARIIIADAEGTNLVGLPSGQFGESNAVSVSD